MKEQKYGVYDEWVLHYKYLRNFFLDERYIKVNNKPMLLIYRLYNIPNAENMISTWNKLAIIDGFDGIYIVNTLNSKNMNNIQYADASVQFEPSRSLNDISIMEYNVKRLRRVLFRLYNRLTRNKICVNPVLKYSNVMKKSLSLSNPVNTYAGIFMGWDNSPRKKEEAFIISEASDEEFKHFLTAKLKYVNKHNDLNNQFAFINAWNEWSEGAYLEPDTINKYKYLEIIKLVLDERLWEVE